MEQELYLNELQTIHGESAQNTAQFIPARDLTPGEQHYMFDEAKRHISIQDPLYDYCLPALLPQVPRLDTSVLFESLTQQQRSEWANPEFEFNALKAAEIQRSILLFAQGQPIPKPPESILNLSIQKLQEAYQKQNVREFLAGAANMMFLHPDDPYILQTLGIDPTSMWNTIKMTVEQSMVANGTFDNVLDLVEWIQLIYPGHIQDLQGFDKCVTILTERLSQSRQSALHLFFSAFVYNLAMVTSGGIRLSSNGMELLPYQHNTAQIPSVPIEY